MARTFEWRIASHGVTVTDAVFVIPAKLAVTATSVEDFTDLCVTLNETLDLPAGITTLAGTAAVAVLELLRATDIPPAGAGPEIVTVPVTEVAALPLTVVGESDSDWRVGA